MHFSETVIQDIQGLFQFIIRHRQRRQEPDNIASSGNGQQSDLSEFCRQRFHVLIQFQPQHQAATAYRRNVLVFLDECFQPLLKQRALFSSPRHQILGFHHVQCRQRRGTRKWGSTKCAGMLAGLEHIGQLGPCDDGANGVAAAHCLRHGKGIGFCIVRLEAKPMPRAAHAALDFVTKHQQVFFITKSPHIFHKLFIGGNNAALALKRFEHDRNRLLVDERLHGLNVIEVGMHKSVRHGLEALLNFFLARGSSRCKRPTMKGVLHANDLILALLVPPQPSQFDHAFVGFGTRIREEALSLKRDL